MGELKRFLRDDGMIKVSRGLKETAVRVYGARERLEKRLGREPTMEEISAETGISKEDMAYAMESTAGVESLYQTVYQNDSSPVMLVDKLVTEEYEEKMTNHLSLMEALESLEMREIELIRLRYYQDKTQSEVAKRFGTSQVQISRMEKKIMEKMRKYFEA
jgi:RNA polymerase sporulation-specific sigma factor